MSDEIKTQFRVLIDSVEEKAITLGASEQLIKLSVMQNKAIMLGILSIMEEIDAIRSTVYDIKLGYH